MYPARTQAITTNRMRRERILNMCSSYWVAASDGRALPAPATEVLAGGHRLAGACGLVAAPIRGRCDPLDAFGNDVDVAIAALEAPVHDHQRLGAQQRPGALIPIGG